MVTLFENANDQSVVWRGCRWQILGDQPFAPQMIVFPLISVVCEGCSTALTSQDEPKRSSGFSSSFPMFAPCKRVPWLCVFLKTFLKLVITTMGWWQHCCHACCQSGAPRWKPTKTSTMSQQSWCLHHDGAFECVFPRQHPQNLLAASPHNPSSLESVFSASWQPLRLMDARQSTSECLVMMHGDALLQ